MQILKAPITFDRFVRGCMLLAVVAFIIFTLRYLSTVLIPFFIAWAVAWTLIPIVKFFQHTLHLHYRLPCVLLTLGLSVSLLLGLVAVTAPIFIEGFIQLKEEILHFLNPGQQSHLPHWVRQVIHEISRNMDLAGILQQEDIINALKSAVPKAWDMLISTANLALGIASGLFAVLYLLFILMDYERFSTGWVHFVPRSRRPFFTRLVSDVASGMRGYMRGQAMIALSNTIMFTIGFYVIGLKMWLGMGLFIGIISFVPYIQVVGFFPAAILALLQIDETGRPFWATMLLVVLVYCVVQVIQDAIVTPRVMGKIMGLSPAIILLSLSIWGSLAGIVGLIIALPVTTILITYYRRYIIGKHPDEADDANP